MYNENYYLKCQFTKQAQHYVQINRCFDSVGVDCNCIIGRKMQKINNLFKNFRNAVKAKKLYFLDQIREQGDKLVNNFIQTVRPFLYLFDRDKIYFVYDGKRHRISGKAKGFNWKQTEMTENEEIHYEITQTPKDFWVFYHYIIHTLKFLTYSMGGHVIQAPFEADHQIIKMFYQNKIKCVFSHDHGYVDYGVPLIKQIDEDGEGLVIDFENANLSLIQDIQTRTWIEDTKDIQNFSSLLKRIYLGILCGEKHIESFKALHFNTLIDLLISWDTEREDFCCHMSREYPNLHIPREYASRFFKVRLLFMFATVYSLQNKRLEPLFEDNGVLKSGSRKEKRDKKQIVGEMRNYSVYSPQSYADVVPVIGDKTREEVNQMSNQERDEWLLNGEKQWFSLDVNPEEVRQWLSADISFSDDDEDK